MEVNVANFDEPKTRVVRRNFVQQRVASRIRTTCDRPEKI